MINDDEEYAKKGKRKEKCLESVKGEKMSFVPDLACRLVRMIKWLVDSGICALIKQTKLETCVGCFRTKIDKSHFDYSCCVDPFRCCHIFHKIFHIYTNNLTCMYEAKGNLECSITCFSPT